MSRLERFFLVGLGVLLVAAVAIIVVAPRLGRTPAPPEQAPALGETETMPARVIEVLEEGTVDLGEGGTLPYQRLLLRVEGGSLAGEEIVVEEGTVNVVSQERLFDAYYASCTTTAPDDRTHAGHPRCVEEIVAYKMNWRGETFYSENRVLPLLSDKEARYFLASAAGKRRFFAIVEYSRLQRQFRPLFDLESFRVSIEKNKDRPCTAHATIKIGVGDSEEITAAEGQGPVSALDNALRKALGRFFPDLDSMRLVDFKVRVIDGREGTAARVRVLIESRDQDEIWTTIGVSEDIIEASWQALTDSFQYKLAKTGRIKTEKVA